MKHLALISTIILAGCSGCSGDKLPEPTIAEKRTVAGAKYTAELLACVDDAGSPEASDACAAGVRARWDGGAR